MPGGYNTVREQINLKTGVGQEVNVNEVKPLSEPLYR